MTMISNRDYTRERILKLLEKRKEIDSFEISLILKLPLSDVDRTLDEISKEGTILVF